LEHYKVEVTAEYYCKSDEKLLKLKSYQKCKTLLLAYNIIIHTTECSSLQIQYEHNRYQR